MDVEAEEEDRKRIKLMSKLESKKRCILFLQPYEMLLKKDYAIPTIGKLPYIKEM